MQSHLTDYQSQALETQTVPSEASAPRPTRWIGWSLVAGLAVGTPLGWLLGYLAVLPFLLGLFFFLLFGLIVGATMFRVGSKAATPSRATLWLIGLTAGSTMLFASIWVEYTLLPRSVESQVRRSFFESFSPQRRAELRSGVAAYVAEELRTKYPPGGLVGYVRWAATNGSFDCPRIFKESTVQYRLPQRRAVWITRAALSIAMVQWTILVQFLGLRPRRPKAGEPEATSLDPDQAA